MQYATQKKKYKKKLGRWNINPVGQLNVSLKKNKMTPYMTFNSWDIHTTNQKKNIKKSQTIFWGPVVWIPRIPENERDCLLLRGKMQPPNKKNITIKWVLNQKWGKTPKMDGLFHGKPYEQMDDLGGSFTPYFWVNTQIHPPKRIRIFTLVPTAACFRTKSVASDPKTAKNSRWNSL